MTGLGDITSLPIAYDRERAAETRARYDGFSAAERDLFAGAAGSSPWLNFLLEREAAWLRERQGVGAGELAAQIMAGAGSGADLAVSLRQARRRLALVVALADLGGIWGLDEVTSALTGFADLAVQAAAGQLFAAELTRGRMPGVGPGDEADLGGYFVLAMGKGGAGELNYSSDIDLICLFDEARYPAEDMAEIRAGFIRITKGIVRMLSEVTAEGFVFRTDLRLRPNPAVTPVCIGMEHAEQYYESLGRTWERAAFIKARPCAGDLAAGERFLTALRPFVWRRHLDFAAIQDAHDMRLRIHEHRGIQAEAEPEGLNLKLAPGGIRDIEFFAQTRQLICGGRDPGLRQRRTLDALQALCEKGWITSGTENDLRQAYVAHRMLEHRIQMMDDAQSHSVPSQPAQLDRLARLCGYAETPAFRGELAARLAGVRSHTEAFFSGRAADIEQPDLAAIFARPEAAVALTAGWENLPALRNDRARALFHQLLPGIFRRMAAAGDADTAILRLDSFLTRLPAGVQLFSLFQANPQLLDLLVDICATAPGLASYLGQNPKVLDAVIGSDFFAPLPGTEALLEDLASVLAEAADYEACLNMARVWVKEQQFRVGVQLLRGVCDPGGAARGYTAVAEACLRALFPHVAAEIALRHGPMPGRGVVVLAMGKFGSGEMSATSDLDLIAVYDAGGAEKSDGPRPLYVAQYYARLTQALVSALTVPTEEGAIYKVDMRLRPSGQKGPAAVALSGFAAYQLNEAWTWEHLALCRARVVAGSADLGADVEAAISRALAAPHDAGKVLADLRDMRGRLAEANAGAGSDPWEVKLGPGRLLDIGMVLQTGMVLQYLPDCRSSAAMLDHLTALGWLSADDGAVLRGALQDFAAFQQFARLAIEGGFDEAKAGAGLMALIAAQLGVKAPDSVQALLARHRQNAAAVVDRRLAGDGKRE